MRAADTLSVAGMTALVTACTAALPSLAVAEAFCNSIGSVCTNSREGKANAVTCGAAGVIPAVIAAMSVHGAGGALVAASGYVALASLADGNAVNADAIVGCSGGLDVLLSVMACHAADGEVQAKACWALWGVAGSVSSGGLTAMRQSRAMQLIRAAKVNLSSDNLVMMYADGALATLKHRPLG